MANGGNEAQCLTCIHMTSMGNEKICSLHKVKLPADQKHYLICRKWEDKTGDSKIAWWKQECLLDITKLYKYDSYSRELPSYLAAFADLEKCE
ncbi:MAG: hypothetical protein ABL919_05520 [Methylococcales bacterium]|nr:hypothetical protein [Methylococcaceae bacterium]